MVDSISNAGYFAYNPYGYTQKYNDDFMAQSLMNNYGNATESSDEKAGSDTVSFTGSGNTKTELDETEKSSSNHSILWTVALVGGAFLAGKYFNKIKGLFKSNTVKEAASKTEQTVSKSQQTIDKAKGKVQDMVTPNKKQKIKNKSVTGASNPITNEMEAATIQNINTGHANGNTRNVVDTVAADTVTPEAQKAYDAEIAYREMTRQQRKINNANNANNTAQRAEQNSVKNNSKGGEKLEDVAQNLTKTEKAARKIADGAHVHPLNKNIYYTKNGKVTRIILADGNAEVTDPKKIAKHLAKHNIEIENFLTDSNKRLNIAA